MCVCVYIYIDMCVCMYVCMYIYTYIHPYIYIHIYIYMHSHIYTSFASAASDWREKCIRSGSDACRNLMVPFFPSSFTARASRSLVYLP